MAALAVLAVLFGFAWRAAQPHGTPSGQIREALLNAADALEDGRVGEAMRAVSSNYQDSTGLTRAQLYVLAREASRSRRDWNAIVEDISPMVRGDEAEVRVRVAIRGAQGGPALRREFTLHMRREEARAWLVFPTHRWRIVSAEGLPMVAPF